MAKILKTYLKYFVPHFYGGGDSAAKAPDPNVTADAQFKYNKKAAAYDAKLNRYTQNNPLGQVSWENKGTDKNPNWVQNTKLSDSQQRIYEGQQGAQGLMADKARTFAGMLDPQQSYKADFTGLAPLNQSYATDARLQLDDLSNQTQGADEAARNRVEQAMYERMSPAMSQQTDALRTQLVNQGLTPGTEAYQRAMLQNSQGNNDAMLAVIAQGGAEMQRNQQMNMNNQNQVLSNANGLQALDLTGRDQYLSEEQQKQALSNNAQNQDLATYNTLLQGSGNVNLPTYNGSTVLGTGNPVDVAGLINSNYQAKVGQQNANTASNNAALTGALSAAGTVAGAKLGAR